MAVEAKRGCGYRKVGGLYLVADGAGSPCCKLPLELSICPCCGNGIKQTRGWTWIDAAKMFPDGGCKADPFSRMTCPAANPAVMGRVGLLWIGEKFYPRPVDFLNESAAQGISRRLPAVPREFKAGETWVLFAHPKAIQKPRLIKESPGGYFDVTRPDGEPEEDAIGMTREGAEQKAAQLDLSDPVYLPGVIRISKPRGFEKIVKQSDYDRASAECAEQVDAGRKLEDLSPKTLGAEWTKDQARGITWIAVPDDDKDHQGSVYDKREEETA